MVEISEKREGFDAGRVKDDVCEGPGEERSGLAGKIPERMGYVVFGGVMAPRLERIGLDDKERLKKAVDLFGIDGVSELTGVREKVLNGMLEGEDTFLE